jgi:hypothetical protein
MTQIIYASSGGGALHLVYVDACIIALSVLC